MWDVRVSYFCTKCNSFNALEYNVEDPLKGQYLLMRILDCINNKNYEEALSFFTQLPFDNHKLFEFNYEFMFFKRRFYMFMILSKALDQEKFKLENPEEYQEITEEFTSYGKDSLDWAFDRLRQSINKILIETIELYNSKNRFSYYVGISINTEAFKIVIRAIDIFKGLEGDFDHVCDIEEDN